MNRYFFALNIPAQSKKQLKQWREQLLALPFSAVSEQNFHITLSFLGTLSEPQKTLLLAKATQMATLLNNNQPYTLTIDQLGIFKKAKVLYLANSKIPCWQKKLAMALSQQALELGLFQENRDYLSHITLYRKAKTLPQNLSPPAIDIPISSFSLFQSIPQETGVCYQALHSWYLTDNKN